MMRTNRTLSLVAITAAAGWLATAVPASAAGRQGGGRPTSSRPPSGGGGGSARPSGGSGGSSGGSGGSQPAPRAVPRDSGGSNGGSSGGTSSGTSSRPTSNRSPNAGTPAGRATPPNAGGGPTTVIVRRGDYGGFYPWGYAGLGFGGYFAGYYGYYDPWLYDPYYAPAYVPVGDDEGTLRLKVKPRDAMVYVDGYYAGRVDDFDGVFQRLHMDTGPHTIEIRADGYEPLTFNIDVRRYRSTTYSGELKKTE